MPSEATRAKELAGLIERLEAAAGPDREIDKAILAYLGYTWRGMDYWNADSTKMWSGPVFLTYSIDAALALVERMLPGWSLRLCVHPTSAYVDIYRLSDLTHFPEGGIERRIASPYYDGQFIQHRLPALAICLALLRALSQESHDAE